MCCDFTWSNESIFSKIDKILINDDCLSCYAKIHYVVLLVRCMESLPSVV